MINTAAGSKKETSETLVNAVLSKVIWGEGGSYFIWILKGILTQKAEQLGDTCLWEQLRPSLCSTVHGSSTAFWTLSAHNRKLSIHTHVYQLLLQIKLYPSPFWEEQEGMTARAWGHTELQCGHALELPAPDHSTLCSFMMPDCTLPSERQTGRARNMGTGDRPLGCTSNPRSTGYQLWDQGKWLGPSIPQFKPCMIGIILMPAYRNVVTHTPHPGHFYSRWGTGWAGCVHLKVTEWNFCFLFSKRWVCSENKYMNIKNIYVYMNENV